jgi:uncharacterized protein involved in exopolysaccharide biosynthesis
MLDQPFDRLAAPARDKRILTSRRRHPFGVPSRLLLLSGTVLFVSAAIYPILPRTYTATADILLRPTNQEGATTWDQSVRDALDDNAIQTKIDILRSEPLQLNVIAKHKLTDDPEYNSALHPSRIRQEVETIPWLAPWLPAKQSDKLQVEMTLVKNLIVKRERKSYLIQIGYESHDPEKAAALTDSLVGAFLSDQIGRKRESHEALLAALGERVTSLESRYHAEEAAEHDFIMSSGLAHVSDRDSMEQQLLSLSIAVAEAHRRTVDTATRADMLAQQRGGGLESTSDALTSPLLQRLRERYVELSTGAAGQGVPVGASQAITSVLRQTIDAETQHLVKAAQNDASVARLAEASLRIEIARIDAKMIEWQQNERNRVDLRRVVLTTLDALNGANQRYMQEAGRGDVLQPDVEIVSRAQTPERPSFPSPLLYGAGTLSLIILLDGLLLLPTMMRQAAERNRSVR